MRQVKYQELYDKLTVLSEAGTGYIEIPTDDPNKIRTLVAQRIRNYNLNLTVYVRKGIVCVYCKN